MRLAPYAFVRKKIGRRFSFTIIFTLVIAMSLFLYYDMASSMEASRNELNQKMNTMSGIAGNALSQAVWNFDELGARSIADSMLEDKEIAGIKIFGDDNKLVYANNKTGEAYISSFIVEKDARILNNRRVIGYAVISFTNYYMDQEVQGRVIKRVLQIVAISMLMIIIITVVSSRVTKPIKLLSRETDAITAGDLSRRIVINSSDEIGELADKFNSMLIALNKAHEAIACDALELEQKNREILVYSEQLEILVEARTMDYNRANNDLIRKNEELEKTILSLGEAQQQLIEAEKMAALGGLVAGVAHEINTPLGVGITTASFMQKISNENRSKLLEGTMSKTDLIEYMENINESIEMLNINLKRAADLIRNFKRIATDISSDQKTSFKLHEIIDAVIISLKHEYKKHGHKIIDNCPQDLAINSYSGDFSQIFTNLIMNSISHGFKNKEKGNMQISAELNDEQLTVVYTDDGSGIKEENIRKIFDPFFTTNRQAGNSGLGLNIIYNIITQHLKGTIYCESTYGSGVKFIMEIPISSIK